MRRNLTSAYSGRRQNPEPGVKPHLLDDVVGEDPAEDDPEAAPEDGAHGQPDADVEVGVVLFHVDLRVVGP